MLCDRFEATEIELPQEIVTPGDPSREFLRARMGKAEALWFFARDKDFAYPEPDFDYREERLSDRVLVTITAKTLLRDFAILADTLHPDAEVDEMLVTLLPGETWRSTSHSARVRFPPTSTSIRFAFARPIPWPEAADNGYICLAIPRLACESTGIGKIGGNP